MTSENGVVGLFFLHRLSDARSVCATHIQGGTKESRLCLRKLSNGLKEYFRYGKWTRPTVFYNSTLVKIYPFMVTTVIIIMIHFR